MLCCQKTYYVCMQYFPVIFVFCLMIYEYLTFMILFFFGWFGTNPAAASIIAIEFHFFFILLIISYYKTCFLPPGFPPDNINDFFPNISEIREKTIAIKQKAQNKNRIDYENKKSESNERILSQNKLESYQAINVVSRDLNSDLNRLQIDELTEVTYCFKCEKIKIPRAHHCRLCNRCILRMDHHCPWTANCVGLGNHKYFVLFLFYTDVCLLNIFCCMGGFAYELIFGGNKGDFAVIINSLLCVVIALTFFCSILFLLIYNIYAICKNITTIESNYEKIIENNPFSRGSVKKNIEEVFGEDVFFWFLPTKPKYKDDYQNIDHSISFYQQR